MFACCVVFGDILGCVRVNILGYVRGDVFC